MHKQVTFKRANIRGQRPNLSANHTVVDEIIYAFTNPQQEPPLPPLPRGKKNPQGGSIAAAILLFLPFLYPITFFVQGATTGHPLPVMMFPLLALMARFLSNVGSLVLYLTARTENFLRKSIGWVSLATLALPLASVLLFGKSQYMFNPISDISKTRGLLALISVVFTLLCMIALCVFAVLMLARVFAKRSEEAK